MDRELSDRIDEEVEGYRKALVHYARACEWDTFEKKAGTLFDYLESVELTVLERKFFNIFRFILVALVGIVIIIMKLNGQALQAFVKYRDSIILAALAVSCFAVYFFLDFRIYVNAKMARYRKRREQFIRNIKDDFKMLMSDKAKGNEAWSRRAA